MADSNGGSNTGVIAVLVIFLVIALGVGIFAFRGKIFGDATKQPDKVDINVTIPSK